MMYRLLNQFNHYLSKKNHNKKKKKLESEYNWLTIQRQLKFQEEENMQKRNML